MSFPSESSSASLSSLEQVLHEVLNEKISDLKTQKSTLESHYRCVREEAASKETDPIARIKILYDGVKNSPVPQSTRKVLDGLPLFLKTAAEDPSCSSQLINHWMQVLETEISFALSKCEYSYIFGKIMQDERRNDLTYSQKGESWAVGEDCAATLATEREKTIQKLEERVFAATPFDQDAFRLFFISELLNLENIEVHEVLKTVRDGFKRDLENLLEHVFTEEDMVSCIDGLLSMDLLNQEEKKTLLWLKENRPSLCEVATLLTNRLKKLKEWQWPPEGVYINVLQSMSGKYRAFVEEDIPTALFLQFIGVRFCVLFQENLLTIYQSRIWRRNAAYRNASSIEHVRYCIHKTNFLSVLPTDAKAAPPQTGYGDDDNGTKPIDVNNSLLHVLNTEARLHQVVSPSESFIVVRTNLEWFEPSIPHEAIHAMLEFFGIPEIWRNFIRKFLQVPMVFNPGEQPRVRRCGVSISHPLSTMCAESLLFLLDLYVNQTTGVDVHRIHDDFWFWDRSEETVCKAWEAMQRFTELLGLNFNMEKSGSAKVLRREEEIEIEENDSGPLVFGKEPLPQSSVRWGLTVLHSDAVFRIDYDALRPHIEEKRRQLNTTRTVMEWVNVYNRYTAFFMRNFGKFANIFGMQHLGQMSRAMKWIQTRVFKEHAGNPLAELKSRFHVFGNVDILDMWAYWPLVAGGLGLRNVYMEIAFLKEALLEEDGVPKEEEAFFTRLPQRDQILWEEAEKLKMEAAENDQKDIDCESLYVAGYTRRNVKPETFESYCSKRETLLDHWRVEYLRAMTVPESEHHVFAGLEIEEQLSSDFDVRERAYALQLLSYYGNQLGNQFGTLQFINPELIPRDMVDSLKAAAIKWED